MWFSTRTKDRSSWKPFQRIPFRWTIFVFTIFCDWRWVIYWFNSPINFLYAMIESSFLAKSSESSNSISTSFIPDFSRWWHHISCDNESPNHQMKFGYAKPRSIWTLSKNVFTNFSVMIFSGIFHTKIFYFSRQWENNEVYLLCLFEN